MSCFGHCRYWQGKCSQYNVYNVKWKITITNHMHSMAQILKYISYCIWSFKKRLEVYKKNFLSGSFMICEEIQIRREKGLWFIKNLHGAVYEMKWGRNQGKSLFGVRASKRTHGKTLLKTISQPIISGHMRKQAIVSENQQTQQITEADGPKLKMAELSDLETPWRRGWQPTAVFLPGEFHGQGSLAAAAHGITESHRTERLTFHWFHIHDFKLRSALSPAQLFGTKLLCPWEFPSKDTGVGCHFLLQGLFPTQGSNPGFLHCRQILYRLSYKGSPV